MSDWLAENIEMLLGATCVFLCIFGVPIALLVMWIVA